MKNARVFEVKTGDIIDSYTILLYPQNRDYVLGFSAKKTVKRALDVLDFIGIIKKSDLQGRYFGRELQKREIPQQIKELVKKLKRDWQIK